MIFDNKEMFSDAQGLTASAASSKTPLDFGSDRNIGIGEPMAVAIIVDVAADITTGDETYAFALQTDDNSGFTSPTTIETRTIAAANLTAGSIHVLPVPPDKSMERYARVYYTLGGTTPTVTVTAALVPQREINNAVKYPAG